jgi:heme/copper-type cytochrome/quinol oxidase subunit 2
MLAVPLRAQDTKPAASAANSVSPAEPRLIEVLADHDSRYRIAGQDKPSITLTAGEQVRLRITAVKAKNKNRDGAVHGFTLLRAKERTPVEGWDFELMPGVQEFEVTAPKEPGEYVVVCTVICSSGHERMNMKVIVVPNGG